MTKHKVFISYHHDNDQSYKDKFEENFTDLFINKSVGIGEISEDVSTDYIKRLIQENYITDSSVLVVLIGSDTYKRKHVDWEISAALNKKVGGYSGLIGILLPAYYNNPDNEYLNGSEYNPTTIPARLNDNVNSDYASIYKWSSAISKNSNNEYYIKSWIQKAFDNRVTLKDKIDNSREQMKYNKA